MDQQMNPLAGRMTYRLTLDSSEEQRQAEEERKEREEYERLKEEKRKRKEEKRKRREEEERLAKEKAKQAAEKKKQQLEKYNDPAKLFESDSSSGDRFARIHKKINEMYPKVAKRKLQSSSEEDSEEDQDDDESDESKSSEPKKKTKKIEKKIQKKRNRDQEESNQRKIKVKATVKIEQELTVKDRLVQELAVRWWYALPEWPPLDYDYDAELKKKGYRLIKGAEFKFADEVLNGLVKVAQLDGYPGVYKAKHGLVDVRPKSEAPTINYFYEKSEAELSKLLKTAVQKQLEELQNVEFKQSGEDKLITTLQRKLITLK